jgi:hypothetical protein
MFLLRAIILNKNELIKRFEELVTDLKKLWYRTAYFSVQVTLWIGHH